MDYQTITEDDKLRLALDTLRARESDHYRLGLTGENAGRVQQLEDEIERLRVVVDELREANAPDADKKPKTTSRRKK